MIMRRLAQFVRMLACVCVCECSRACACANARVRVRVRMLVCECSRACASVCVGRLVSRLRRSSCLASASVVLSRVCVCVCVRLCASMCVGRLVSRLHASACGNWLILCVGRHSKSLKVGGTGSGFCYLSCVILSAVFYNVLMLKYPSHHLIYVFYHPMPIMPLY